MQAVYRRCAGLDVHKDSITATILVFPEAGKREVRTKEFRTYWKDLQLGRICSLEGSAAAGAMAAEFVGGVRGNGVDRCVLEPVWNVLETTLRLVLANPYQIKNIPSQKTDRRDSVWIADLLAHGLIKPSFVPPPEIRQLRDLTRLRVQVTGEHTRVHNRIHKVLEDANIKLDTVLSDLLGVSGRGMLRGLIQGRTDPGWLADYARGSLRGKREQLELVLRGRVTEHHRYLLAELMAELEFLEDRLARLDQQLSRCMQPFQAQVDRLCGIPGVDLLTAWTLIAELGVDMTVFPDAAHAVSWAGLCPGNRESAGKRLSSRSKKGNRWIRRALCQSAWAVTRKRNCHLTALFYRLTARMGVKKAIVAVAHQILVTAFSILRNQTQYQELGGDFFDQQHPQRTQNRLVRRLERLGLQVVITAAKPPADPAPSVRPPGRPCKCLERAIDCKHKRL